MASKYTGIPLSPRLILIAGIFIFGITSAMSTRDDGGSSTTSPAWSEVALPGATSSGMVSDIAIAGPGFVAVGSDESGAAVWVSTDGREWDRLPHDEATFGPMFSEMTAVTATGPGVVAAGASVVAVGNSSLFGPAMWRSPDGINWNLSPLPLHSNLNSRASDVIAAPFGLIVVGRTSDNFNSQGAIWVFSHDQTAVPFWVPSTTIAIGPQSAILGVSSTNDFIAANGGPAFVAVGLGSAAAVWKSSNGTNWESLPFVSGISSSSWLLTAMVTGQAIYVGGREGGVPSGSSSIWKSLDKGETWVRLTDDGPENATRFEEPHVIHKLLETDAFGFNELAFGRSWSEGSSSATESVAGLWRGATGYPRWGQWTETGFPMIPGLQLINSAASTDDLIVAVGRDHDGTPAIWTFAR